MGYSIGKKVSDQLQKVELNEFGDYILLNPGDASFSQKFGDLIKWINDKSAEMSKIAADMGEKYKDTPMIHMEENGDAEIDTEQFSLYVKIKTDLYEECGQRIDQLFGQDTLKKYFRAFYEINPDFIPDEDCIRDFMEEIAPVLGVVYNERFERINKKYNKNRKGGHSGK